MRVYVVASIALATEVAIFLLVLTTRWLETPVGMIASATAGLLVGSCVAWLWGYSRALLASEPPDAPGRE